MSSTEHDADARARDAFVSVLVPLAEAARARGKEYFPLGPDPVATSYFAPAVRSAMVPEDFDRAAIASAHQLIDELVRSWLVEGNDDLAALAPELHAIADVLAAEPQAESDSVAQFIYTMF